MLETQGQVGPDQGLASMMPNDVVVMIEKSRIVKQAADKEP